MKKILFVVLVLVMFQLTSLGASVDYYVDQKNQKASDENPGTEALPWKSIGKAVNVAKAGDTVWIKRGIYREEVPSFANSGAYASEVSFITLSAYGDDRVVIDGTRKIDAIEWQREEGTENVFSIPLPEDPNQVFVDGQRYPESVEVVVDDKPNVEYSTDRTTTHADHPLTDKTPKKWWYNPKDKRLYLNTGDGNPSTNHTVDVPVYSFGVGRGVYNIGIRLRGLTFDKLRDGLVCNTEFSVIEDCVIRQAGGTSALYIRGMHNIIRRNTVLNSLHQAIYWVGSNYVLEDNLVVGALQDPHIVDSAWEGAFKTNGGSYSTIRNNVVAEVEPGEHHAGGWGIWCDINSDYNAIYGNVSYRQYAGIYVEQTQNANVIAYNTCFENQSGIGVRNNIFNLILGNYLFNNENGIRFSDENRYPPMSGQRVEGNWLINNNLGISVGLPAPLGWNVASLDRNLYTTSADGKLVKWGDKVYVDLETLRSETGQEFNGRTGTADEKEIQVIKFRVPYSRTPDMLVPMVANPTLLRPALSGIGAYAGMRPYFWRQGAGSGASFGVETSYPNLPGRWVDTDRGFSAGGITGLMLGLDGRALEKHEGPGEKRWGIYVVGSHDMNPMGGGWWSPSLPTMAGTKYKISWSSLADNLEPVAGDQKSGPVVFVQWTNDTGQKKVKHYLWGVDENGKSHGKLGSQGSYPWAGDSGEVTAPEGATRVSFFFGLRKCKGIIKYRDMWIQAE